MPDLSFERIHTEAQLPRQAHPGDLGLDLYAIESAELAPGERTLVGTGIVAHFPEDTGALIKDRSSMAMRGLHCLAGVIDAGYRGEIKVLIANLGAENQTITVGDRFAQLVPFPVQTWHSVVLEDSDQVASTQRGAGGFGSTGR